MNHRHTNKTELQHRKPRGARGGRGRREGVLNLYIRAKPRNSDAASKYKYIFGPHKGPLPNLWNITVKTTYKPRKCFMHFYDTCFSLEEYGVKSATNEIKHD